MEGLISTPSETLLDMLMKERLTTATAMTVKQNLRDYSRFKKHYGKRDITGSERKVMPLCYKKCNKNFKSVISDVSREKQSETISSKS